MNDDLEPRLREALHRADLPGAPASTREWLAHVTEEPRPTGGRLRLRPLVILVPAAALLLAFVAFGGGLASLAPGPSPSPTAPAPSPTVQLLPATVDGLPVMTVSEALAARAAGGLRSQPVAVGGYWSDRSVRVTCTPPPSGIGELELYCGDELRGITERDEPIGVIERSSGRFYPAVGPHLTPWVPDALATRLSTLPVVNGEWYPPVPIVVVGHFDDPRAADCRPQARQLCLDRLVVDRIALFDPSSVPAPSASSSPPATLRTFAAPGISFDYPADWTDQTSVAKSRGWPGVRVVAFLARNSTFCPFLVATPAPTPVPGTCEMLPTAPGSMQLWIEEAMDPLPTTGGPDAPLTVAGYPAWERPQEGANGVPPGVIWTIQAPDGGIYIVMARAPEASLDARRAEIEAMLASLRLSAWEVPPKAVDGRVHLDLLQGFAFDYPAGWNVYYPTDNSTMDSAVVTVASAPVLPSCAEATCPRFLVPPGAVVIEFRVGGGPTPPDWRKAPTTVGGQPAFKEDWSSPGADGAEEGHTWSVRLTGRSSLSIHASLRGPNLPALRAAMDEVLRSVRITAEQSPAP